MIKIYCRTPIIVKKYSYDDLGRRITGSGSPEIVHVKGRVENKIRRIVDVKGEVFTSEISILLPSLIIQDRFSPGPKFTVDLNWFVEYQGIEWPIRKIVIAADFRDRSAELFL